MDMQLIGRLQTWRGYYSAILRASMGESDEGRSFQARLDRIADVIEELTSGGSVTPELETEFQRELLGDPPEIADPAFATTQ